MRNFEARCFQKVVVILKVADVPFSGVCKTSKNVFHKAFWNFTLLCYIVKLNI